MCQLYELHLMSKGLSPFEKGVYFGKRILRFLRNRFILLNYTLKRLIYKKNKSNSKPALKIFEPGDTVRVKLKSEIMKTLDGWRRTRGCRFMDEMWKYCGSTHRVYKKVNYMLDEKTMKMRRSTHMYILEGLVCEGSWPFKNCDRSCFFFWRAEWLEKIK